jgi:hypothetical protein
VRDMTGRGVEQGTCETETMTQPPIPFSRYVEQTVYSRIRAAYEHGFARGSRHLLMMLIAGLVAGFMIGFYTATA